VAVVPSETTSSYYWLLQRCFTTVFDLETTAIFTDRGKVVQASTLLARDGLCLALKYGTVHIQRNIVQHFGAVGQEVSNYFWQLKSRVTPPILFVLVPWPVGSSVPSHDMHEPALWFQRARAHSGSPALLQVNVRRPLWRHRRQTTSP
jgi:hypothetical protein